MAAYRDGGWRLPEIMPRMPDGKDVYLDSLSKVSIDRYADRPRGAARRRRVRQHARRLRHGLAVVGAYVLAGELAAANGDHAAGFRALRGAVPRLRQDRGEGQRGPVHGAADADAASRMRNWTFKSRCCCALMLKMTDNFATDIELKDYR